jgi:hypothetical protein
MFHSYVNAINIWNIYTETSKIVYMYVCMYKGWAMKSGPCTATFNDLFCFPFCLTLC